MKKLSEVCEIVGVTRRTLQEYDKIGLLSPTAKTRAGYWLYDDASIKKLMLIQIFVECGYKRLDIKAILESPTLNEAKEYNRLINELEDKKHRISRMIDNLKVFAFASSLPASTICALNRLDVSRIYKNKSFLSCIKESLSMHDGPNDLADKEIELGTRLFFHLIAIGSFVGTDIESKKVQEEVENAYNCLLEIIQQEYDTEGENIDVREYRDMVELKEAISGGIEEMLSDNEEPEIHETIEAECGKGAVEYIEHAFRNFAAYE